jgi:hypothetical protein
MPESFDHGLMVACNGIGYKWPRHNDFREGKLTPGSIAG